MYLLKVNLNPENKKYEKQTSIFHSIMINITYFCNAILFTLFASA